MTRGEEFWAELSPSAPSQAGSQQRQQDLNSLQDYMQRCTNKLYWLDQQAKDRTHYDWSDHNLDYPSRRRQYEVRARSACSPALCRLGTLQQREVGREPGGEGWGLGWGQGNVPPLPRASVCSPPQLRHEAL